MTSTPPPPSAARARTPPTPLHGARYDNYEPYSPRRSKRSTAHSNPYSSFNGERSPKAPPRRELHTPPATVKKTRFARAPTHLSSPPSSPASPVQRRSPSQLHKTPRKPPGSIVRSSGANGAHSDSDNPSTLLTATNMHPISMLPTPSKTPKKQRAAVASTARILNFQPDDPNDVMPTPRKAAKHRRNRLSGFDLYDEELPRRSDNIEIFTDTNARVPELDGSEDNPFVGPKRVDRRPPRRNARLTQAQRDMDAAIDDAVQRDEGVAYVFRGKKIFRRFDDDARDDVSDDAGTEVSGSFEQRTLRSKAGASAQRPLTRSAIKPRLLFPSEDQIREREQQQILEEVDEEAVTDIEMSALDSPELNGHGRQEQVATPVSKAFKAVTPPSTNLRTKRSTYQHYSATSGTPPPPVDEPEPMSTSLDDSLAVPRATGKRSPFDTWQRTKGGRKRAGDAVVGDSGVTGGGKRARSEALVESPT